MPFLLLLCLSLACLPVDWPQPWNGLTSRWSLLLTLGLMVVPVAAAAVVARLVVLRISHRPLERGRWIRFYGKARTWHSMLLMGLFVASLYGAGWAWAVQTSFQVWLPNRPMPLGTELLILFPLPAALGLSWLWFYDAERAILGGARPFGGRWSYLTFQIRQNLVLVALPLGVLLLTNGIFRQFPRTFQDSELAQSILMAPIAAGAIVFMPWGVRLLLRLQSMEPGPLRDRLESAARRLDCRCTDILVWHTKLGVANAMVVGVTPWLRYIILSDRLIQEMSLAEIESIFGHEAGHVRHRHMLYYLIFITGSLTLVSRIIGLLDSVAQTRYPATTAWMNTNAVWLALPSVSVLAVYIFSVFGWISRRCERQADVYGCKTVSCRDEHCSDHYEETELAAGAKSICPTGIAIFCHALDRVAVLNGMSRSRPGWLQAWQHSTIARRIDFLRTLMGRPELEVRFQRRLFWTKTLLMALLGLGLVVAYSI